MNDCACKFDDIRNKKMFDEAEKLVKENTRSEIKMNWCYECECKAKDCVCPDWHRHYKTKQITKELGE